MRYSKGEVVIAFFTLAYILGFAAYYVSIRNFEFLWYVAVLVFFFLLIALTLRRSHFDLTILWGLSIWGLLHMAGGGIVVNGAVLYAYPLIPIAGSGALFILKYDQFVHAFGFAIATLVAYHLLKPSLIPSPNWKALILILIVAGAGFGVLNEIVEFIAVLTIPETGVGGYENTALDLVFNTLGATVAAGFLYFKNKSGSI